MGVPAQKSFKQGFRFRFFLLTVLTISLSIRVSSYRNSNINTRRLPVTQGYQNLYKKYYEWCLLDSNAADSCPIEGGGASFELSGSICGQSREYTLDNLDGNEKGNEIKFCGA